MMKISIRKATVNELVSLVPIYQSIFTKHTIFQQSSKDILQYLRKTSSQYARGGGGYLLAIVGKKIVGGILVRKEAEIYPHSVWKLNHLAVLSPYQRKGIGTALLQEAEKIILATLQKRKLSTAKIEIGVAQNEQDAVAFYQRQGFRVEGKLQSHYRHNEMVYVMGKELKI